MSNSDGHTVRSVNRDDLFAPSEKSSSSIIDSFRQDNNTVRSASTVEEANYNETTPDIP